ncbi:2-oxoglutarate dehydrogenase-like, mitochondrial [Nilaparvata lugens]|uniref:2-oxoglutarate dehydrogenase-like, mitochondrial n=1 Tax=Nilaparvata lugens TaxID=108931 RepID=UPI00193D9530|nr:2-oxoglutarate dehydrogenase-like, mitochondrial [Nilaparvata lugens]
MLKSTSYCVKKLSYLRKFKNQNNVKYYSQYAEEMRKFWDKDPTSVHPYWDANFRSKQHIQDKPRSQLKTKETTQLNDVRPIGLPHSGDSHQFECNELSSSSEETIIVNNLIRTYQLRGHYKANIDPLNSSRGPLVKKDKSKGKMFKPPVWLDTKTSICLPNSTYIGYGRQKSLPFEEIVKRLEYTYCNSIGVETVHMRSVEQIDFIRQRMELEQVPPPMSREKKVRILTDLIKAGDFEKFLAKKWPSEKRFGLEGNDSFIPAMNYLVECGASLGAKSFILGIAHRGRLNTLTNVLKVNPKHLFTAFQKIDISDDIRGTGDVKYHLGTTTHIATAGSDEKVKISLLSNPSHLEAVCALVLGKVAAENMLDGKDGESKTWPILIHGDAAMAGQGVVYECIQLSQLENYSSGGAIHIVINNQIGFTTNPKYSCSFEYPTGILKMIGAPVFHVNGNDVDAVIHCCQVAAQYKATFHMDVGINIMGYRKNGHNETDEPRFTQPLLYKKIDAMKHVQDIYADQLIAEQVVTKEDVDKIRKDYEQELESLFVEASKEKHFDQSVWVDTPWINSFKDKDPMMVPQTGVDRSVLDTLSKVLSTPPEDIKAHQSLVRIFRNRAGHLENGVVDWSCAESFAFGSLLKEGITVRVSGQDVERGTFSHRHHVIHDQTEFTYRTFNLLDNVFPNQANYTVSNSTLSEFGVLGFEVGASLASADALVMWEAQFGDFANTAQVIIDQFIASGESKWLRQSAITLLLPHGLEGMGAEHSSARLERFLQLSDDDESDVTPNMAAQMAAANWLVAFPSTPANLFHLLRRQVKLNYRKPLVVMAPKALLRLPACVSPLDHFITGTMFKPYLPDPQVPASDKVKKLIFCTGKVYYELSEERANKKLIDSIAISRIEQLFPLPYAEIMEDALKSYPNARVFWAQEEHKNSGAWSYMAPRLNNALGNKKGPVNYIGRPPSCVAANHLKAEYDNERRAFLDKAMEV